MARGQSTSDVRVRRRGVRERSSPVGKAARSPLSDTGSPARAVGDASSHPLERILQSERDRLASAQSVLGCLHVALLHADQTGIKMDPDYASAAAIALALIRETADRLDSAIVRPLLTNVEPGRGRRKSTSSRS